MKKAILIIILGLSLRANLFALGKYDQQTWKAAQPSTSTIDGTVTVTNERWQAGDFNIGISTFNVYLTISSTGQIRKLIGAYLDISTNVYIVGYASAAYFYGDGSNLTNLTSGDVFLASTQTFTGQNTFTNEVTISSNTSISGNLTVDKKLIFGDAPVQNLETGSTILSADSFYNISSTSDIVMTATPTIADGVDIQWLVLRNTGTFYIDIQDDADLAGSNVFYGGSSAVIAPKDVITLLYDSLIGGWVIQSHPNLQIAGANADVILVRNTSGTTIPALSAVYASSYNVGQHRIQIDLADGDDSGKMPSIGITPDSIPNGSNGIVVTAGIIEGDLSAYSLGDTLYVSTTAGELTNTRPSVDDIQALAIVTRASVNGSLLVTGAGRSNDVPINFTANIITVSSVTITGTNIILTATSTYSLNSNNLDGKNFDAFVSTIGDTMSGQLDLGSYSLLTSSGITGLKRIVWEDGTVQVSSPTAGVGNGGQPDIMFDYTGDIFNSTATYINGLSRIISKYALTVASYQVYIGSATSDSFDIRISTMVLGSTWVSAEVFSVPVGVSSHTVTSSGYTVSDGGVVSFGFEGVSEADPAGDISIKISN